MFDRFASVVAATLTCLAGTAILAACDGSKLPTEVPSPNPLITLQTCSPDQTPPTITSLAASPNVLWPPNHKFVSVRVALAATDNCTPAPVCAISGVTSNEPVNGLGDGNTAPDWLITGAISVLLRAERSGRGTGRVYTIAVSCRDAAGNTANGTTTVLVPHDQRRHLGG
ncbi:MAG: hypothetical protein ABR543_17825 [Gemmatimonadaceae bacterium]